MRNQSAIVAAIAAVLGVGSIASAGLTVSAIGKNYTVDPAKTPSNLYFSGTDLGGSTSIRNADLANLEWKVEGYYQRNRDLGQVFNLMPGQNLVLDALVLRTGNSSSAILPGTANTEVFLQFFELSGAPTINNNGTAWPNNAAHGFTTYHSADDFIEGVTYSPLKTITGGIFPNLPATTQNGGQAGHLQYLRFDLTGDDEILLEGGKRYAFMVGFVEPGPDRGFTLGNTNRVTSVGQTPALYNDPAGAAWWSIRREGDGTLPPTMHPGANPPSNPAIHTQLINESLFATGPDRYTLRPTTDGYPDVDTYRTLTFFMETRPADVPPPPPPPPTDVMSLAAAKVGWSIRSEASSPDTDPAQVRSDPTSTGNQRKAWVQFDLSDPDIDWSRVTSVRLTLVASDQVSNTNQPSTRVLHIYGIDGAAWPTGDISWANGPGNDVNSAYAFLDAALLGTHALFNSASSSLEAIGDVLRITLNKDYFINDADKRFILGLSYGGDAGGAGSFKFYNAGVNAPKIAVEFVVPEPASLSILSAGLLLLVRRRRS